MSTISGKTVTQTVTLGTVGSYPTYVSPLTIPFEAGSKTPQIGCRPPEQGASSASKSDIE
jgi:hypothetical protein